MGKFRLAILGLGLVIGASVLLAGCGEKPVAKVDGIPITRDQFMTALEQGVGLTEGFSAGQRTLDMLIIMQLVEQAATKQGITISETELKKAMDEERKRFEQSGAAANMSYEEVLKKAGVSQADLEKQKRFGILLRKLVVTKADAEEYFRVNQKDFDQPETAYFVQMALPSRDAAQAAYKLVTTEKQDFAKIATERSMPNINRAEQPFAKGTAENAAAMGAAQLKPLYSAFESRLFQMSPGQVSQPFEASIPVGVDPQTNKLQMQNVWLVMKVTKRTPAKKASLKDNLEQVESIVFQKKQDKVQQYLISLRAKARLEVVDPKYTSLKDQYNEAAKAVPTFTPPTPEEMQKTMPTTPPGAASSNPK